MGTPGPGSVLTRRRPRLSARRTPTTAIRRRRVRHRAQLCLVCCAPGNPAPAHPTCPSAPTATPAPPGARDRCWISSGVAGCSGRPTRDGHAPPPRPATAPASESSSSSSAATPTPSSRRHPPPHDGATLVRPNGYIAWRSATAPARPIAAPHNALETTSAAAPRSPAEAIDQDRRTDASDHEARARMDTPGPWCRIDPAPRARCRAGSGRAGRAPHPRPGFRDSSPKPSRP